MQFAVAFPWWVLLLMAVATGAVAWGLYAGRIVPLPRGRRTALAAIRALTLLFLMACLLRPVRIVPPDASADAVVPVLIDASRSMGLPDVGGVRRIDVARDLLRDRIQPALDGRFRSEVWTFGDRLAPAAPGALAADGRRSDLSGALRAVRERYRERRVAGVVVISDGGDTGTEDASGSVSPGEAPVYAIGVGAPRPAIDFEVLDVAAGEAALTESSVDLSIAAVSRGRAAPFDLRILENGRPIDLRRVTPAADGSPVRAVVTVSPPRETATLYTVEIPSAAGDVALDNNRRSVLVEPPGRPRRVLMIEGSPGFEHSFIKRALATDAGIELDSVVRKGRDVRGASTYFVQASDARAPRLAGGFPQERAALYEYDAVVLANLEGDALSRPQLQMLSDFVDQRGGGLLMLGAKSFLQQGFGGTPLEDVLPLRLTDRGNGVIRTSAAREPGYAVTLTSDGQAHPVMRIGATAEETESRWRAIPPLAGVAPLGSLRPGAQALALVQAPDGARPLLAVQRFGQGRAMIFAGEASWRWRMRLPSEDRSHELFWRQAVRWAAAGAPDRVSIAPLHDVLPGTGATVAVDVRNGDFTPVADANVRLRVTLPGGGTQDVAAALADQQSGRYAGEVRFEEPGVYRITATAQRGGATLARSERWVLAGGSDLEMADPRLNEDVLRRVASASGGSYLRADEAGELRSLLASSVVDAVPPRLEELWHNVWIFATLLLLLALEWTLRRRWGLR